MGTSSNQPSPARDPSWIAARKILANARFSVERQSQELWRAAASDPDVQLGRTLGDPIFAAGASIAATSKSVSQAIESFSQELVTSKASSIFTEIGTRALARAVHRGTGMPGFAAELFAETVSYYVSRDLPSVVGALNRTETVSAAILLKQSVTERARATALERARAASPGARGWNRFVASTLSALRGDSK